ncbi:hypothetical protein PVL29_011582 [Vitis rotundifolia]|uniref:Uncharacterized protein n=1 Tax=Vitis rotundifolia TaxID=103349 RepID=A0AA39DPR0_VITRO|nr:hypothetical protein PVL29_011582 [Vitis rotundifolia]
MQRDQERPFTSSDSDSNSSSSCDSEDGAVSTSENADAIYEEKVESECDMMYAKSASKNVESKNENSRLIEEKNIELKVGDKSKSKIGTVEGGLTMHMEVGTKH